MMALLLTVHPTEARMCPDGSFGAGNKCTMAPDGSFVGGRAHMAPDGSFVGDGHLRQKRSNSRNGSGRKRMSMCPDGSFVMGR